MPITIGDKTYTDEQVKKFYADGGDERQFAQQNGITDPWQERDLALQARGIAGSAPTMQQNFQQYQKANPNGAFQNDYAGWLNDMKNGNPSAYNAMMAGTYTGAPNAATDWDVGGIYGNVHFGYDQSGQGLHGVGDGWSGAAPTGTNATASASPRVSASYSGGGMPSIMSANPAMNGVFGFQQTGPNMAIAGQYQQNQQPAQVSPVAAMQSSAQPAMMRSPAQAASNLSPQALGNALGNWSALGYKPSWAQ